jgi:protein CpxP
MKSLALATAAGILLAGASMAQTTSGTGSTAGTGPTGAAPMTPSARNNSDTAAASGNGNQTVATTSANSPSPAKGANSFTMGEARSRIEKNGFTNVSDLAKDENGVWRGKAQKGGSPTSVWVDYKGNVGATN